MGSIVKKALMRRYYNDFYSAVISFLSHLLWAHPEQAKRVEGSTSTPQSIEVIEPKSAVYFDS